MISICVLLLPFIILKTVTSWGVWQSSTFGWTKFNVDYYRGLCKLQIILRGIFCSQMYLIIYIHQNSSSVSRKWSFFKNSIFPAPIFYSRFKYLIRIFLLLKDCSHITSAILLVIWHPSQHTSESSDTPVSHQHFLYPGQILSGALVQ